MFFSSDNGSLITESEYVIETIVQGLNFPTSITFDTSGNIYIAESGYSYGPVKVEGGGKIKRIDVRGNLSTVAENFEGPLTGIKWHKGKLYAITGSHFGKVYMFDGYGGRKVIVDGLPTGGDHYTSNIVFDNEDRMYFGSGTFTNSAVVGIDNFMMGWLAEHPDWHDIPPRDYVLTGNNYISLNPFSLSEPEIVKTGAFQPFGKLSVPGETVKGQFKANGVIYSALYDGKNLDKVADGLRNPYALGFSQEGKLLCIDQGYDARGSRPIANAPDPMWEIKKGGWYGWPDFVAGIPVNDKRFAPVNGEIPELVLKEHPPLSGELLATFEPHAAAMNFDMSYSPYFGYQGDVFVALFGSLAPMTGTVRNHPGHKIVRVNLEKGKYYDFVTAKDTDGHSVFRPIDVKFNMRGDTMFVLDFGRIDVSEAQMTPFAESGRLVRIRRRR